MERGQRRKGGMRQPTIRMPYLAQKSHTRRRERIILWELQLCREDAAFERCALWSLNQSFPVKQVVFRDGAGGDAFWGVIGEGFVFLEEASLGSCRCHCGRRIQEEVEVVGGYVVEVEVKVKVA